MKRRVVLSVVFGVFYYVAILIGDALGAGSTWREGAGHALFFGTFALVVTLPVILLAQAWLTRRIRNRLARPLGRVPVWEFVPIILISLFSMSEARPRTPEHYFKRFVADRMPQSVSDLKCWHTSGFGNSSWILCFRIAPQEFDQVLARHRYKKTEQPDGIELMLLKIKTEGREAFPVPYPRDKMAVSYEYHDPEPGDGPRVSIYANEARDLVYVIGGNG
jgi:hypothetical protein